MKRALWNPWHGCHKCSPGCLNCFVYYFDNLRGKDTNVVVKSKTNFQLPLKKNRMGDFKIEKGSQVATCFTSDFFIEEADNWRQEAWDIIKKRPDVQFLICTKRIERFKDCVPSDWGDGYDNVIIAVTCENQEKANKRLPILLKIKAKYKYIFVAPILEYVDLRFFLKSGQINLVSVGGESYLNARPCHFSWVQKIKEDCDQYQVPFDFHQTGAHFIVKGKHYFIKHSKEYFFAKKGMKCLENMKK